MERNMSIKHEFVLLVMTTAVRIFLWGAHRIRDPYHANSTAVVDAMHRWLKLVSR